MAEFIYAGDAGAFKTCTKCGNVRDLSGFYRQALGVHGRRGQCKSCSDLSTTGWRIRNPDKVTETERNRAPRVKDNEAERRRSAIRRMRNPEKAREKSRRDARIRRSTVKGKLENVVRVGMLKGLAKGSKSGRKTFDLLGYTVDDLTRHLERLFEPGMSWENHGNGGWNIDHIIPLAAHNYSTPDDHDFKRAWALSNLRPLWERENKSKNAKLYSPFQPSLSFGC